MKKNCKDLSIVWKAIIVYLIITVLLVSIFDPIFLISPGFIISRTILLIFLFVRLKVKTEFFKKYGILADTLMIYALLSYFYGETAHLNTFFFQKIDPIISNWDQWIFGYQPSVFFSEKLNHPLFSELMYFGYFTYYLMPFSTFLIIWKYKNQYFEEFSFLTISAYLSYYLIFIFLPSEGPQFYFQPPLNHIEAFGPFGYIIKTIQHYGEARTAAFPSSHIGVSVIMLVLVFRNLKTLYKILLPFCITLMFSTVYIKAHYFVDVVAGLLSAPVVLFINKHIYHKINALSLKMVYVDRN